jgi:hypothetical protein
MKNLREQADIFIKNKRKYLADSIKAKKLIELLPEEIIQLKGEVDWNSWGSEYGSLHVTIISEKNDDAVNVLKRHGIMGLVYTALSETWFKADGGKCVLPNGMPVYFEVWNAERPANCILVEVMKSAYEIKCAETIMNSSQVEA